MAFIRPALKEIVDRVKTDITSRAGIGSPLRRAFVTGISYAIAGASYLLHAHLDWISKQVIPDTAEQEFLERWASIWGITRTQSSFAEVDVMFTGTNGSVIPAGTSIVRSDGIIYTTDLDGEITIGEAIVHAICETSGATGTCETGSKLTLVSPIAGVSSQGTVQATNKIAGSDQETDGSLLARLLSRIQRPPNGGSANDYIQWALEVSGVTRAWVYPGGSGLGTVGLAFVTDNEEDIIPTAGKVTEVQDYIDDRRPVTAEVFVFAPTGEEQDFDIQISPNTLAVRTAIEAELADLFSRESEPGGTILISHIREAISIASGEADHVLVSPIADIVADPDVLKVMGTVTFNPIP